MLNKIDKNRVMSWNCKSCDSDPKILKDIATLISSNKIDIFALIESSQGSSEIVSDLALFNCNVEKIDVSYDDSIKVFARKPNIFKKYKSGDRWVIVEYLNNTGTVYLSFVHLLSKVGTNEITRHCKSTAVMKNMLSSMDGNKPRFIIGDFNENPFESVACSSDCLNSIFPSQIGMVKRKIRTNCENEYHINPSWAMFVNNEYVSGTYYFKDRTMDCLCWNVLDQVVMSVEAYEKVYDKNSLKILTSINNNNELIKNGIPDKENYSDHLPIVFDLNN
jgi:hypothetical protein